MFWPTTLTVIVLLWPPPAQVAGSPAADQAAPRDAPKTHRDTQIFDPDRDPEADLTAAMAEAHRTGKRVLVDVGGNWCAYCDQMEHLFHDHADLIELRDAGFVTVAVYFGPGNRNEAFLSRLPPIEGVPHLFVLDERGELLHSEHAKELRSDGNYDAAKVERFLRQWSAPHGETKAGADASVRGCASPQDCGAANAAVLPSLR